MIVLVHEHPQNQEHWTELQSFACEIIAICADLAIVPVLSGSLAVFAYTRQAIPVNDIDLACSEADFPRLSAALTGQGIRTTLKAWHVLQAWRGALKVEFDAWEYWMADLPTTEADTLVIDGLTCRMVCLSNLKELYRRGLVATAGQEDAINQAKYAAIREKYTALCAIEAD